MTETMGTPVPPRRIGGGYNPTKPKGNPPIKVSATVIVQINTTDDPRKLKFSMHSDTDGIVGNTKESGSYILVSKGQHTEIHFRLSDAMDWQFSQADDRFTLGCSGHSPYYCRTDDGKDSRLTTVEIKSTGKNPETDPHSKLDDQKFNLAVGLIQVDAPDVVVIIDPVVKNPPPDGTSSAPAGVSVPIS